jgi:DNA-binding winged helix-turn-helix (wHTH) protein
VVTDIVLDAHTAWLAIGGWMVRLPGREAQLLEQLMLRPGRVVATADLAATVGLDAAHVARLARRLRRRLLVDPLRPPMIESVPGAGYRFLPAGPTAAGTRPPDSRRSAARTDGLSSSAGGMETGPGDWHRGWTALQQFVARRGTAVVPPRAMSYGVAIGSWADSRRQEYWAGSLDPAHVAALESLPGWTWEGRSQKRWTARYEALRRYITDHGPAMPPANATSGTLRIGDWVTAQRRAHKAGNLPKPLAEQLESLPGWNWHDDRWRRGLAAAQAYLAHHATLDSVDDVVIDGFALGRWVKRCRDDYRSGSLNIRQIDDLESLPGWTWRGPDERWRQGIAALRAYYLRYGTARPPQKAIVDGFALGAWVQRYRRDYRRGTLTTERIAELESVPTWAWSVQPRRRDGSPHKSDQTITSRDRRQRGRVC